MMPFCFVPKSAELSQMMKIRPRPCSPIMYTVSGVDGSLLHHLDASPVCRSPLRGVPISHPPRREPGWCETGFFSDLGCWIKSYRKDSLGIFPRSRRRGEARGTRALAASRFEKGFAMMVSWILANAGSDDSRAIAFWRRRGIFASGGRGMGEEIPTE